MFTIDASELKTGAQVVDKISKLMSDCEERGFNIKGVGVSERLLNKLHVDYEARNKLNISYRSPNKKIEIFSLEIFPISNSCPDIIFPVLEI